MTNGQRALIEKTAKLLLAACLAASADGSPAAGAGSAPPKALRFERAYEKGRLELRVRCPKDWRLVERPSALEWSVPRQKGIVFAIHWLNPDHIYDVESLCRAGMCAEVAEIPSASGGKLRIARPTPERRAAMALAEDFLFAEPVDPALPMSLWFTTDRLPAAAFEKLLKTSIEFSFDSDYTACGCGCCGGVEPQRRCLYRSKKDDLSRIIAQDRAEKASPDCAVKGCSRGVRYSYCKEPPASSPAPR